MAELKNVVAMSIEELSEASKKSEWSREEFLKENKLCYTENGVIYFDIEPTKAKVYSHRVANIFDKIPQFTCFVTEKAWKNNKGVSHVKAWRYDKKLQKDVDTLCSNVNEMVLKQMEEYFTSEEYKQKKEARKNQKNK